MALLAGIVGAGAWPPDAAPASGPSPSVFAFGAAGFHGSPAATALAHPVVGIAGTATGHGYWLVASDGGIFTYGDARFYGSTGALHLNAPIVGITATPTGHGYWLVASDGGIFTYGDARFYGSTGALHLNAPIVGITATPTGHGYWLVASDGHAGFYGASVPSPSGQPIVGLASSPTGRGYWIVGRDGHVFARGDARVEGSVPAPAMAYQSIVGIAATRRSSGFWLAAHPFPLAGARNELAIAWFLARLGSRAYEGQCEEAVERSYGTIGRYPTAYAAWLSQPERDSDWQHAPRGALVFYMPGVFGPDGHVGISLGDGYVVSTDVDGRIGVAPIAFFQHPLGWTYEPW